MSGSFFHYLKAVIYRSRGELSANGKEGKNASNDKGIKLVVIKDYESAFDAV